MQPVGIWPAATEGCWEHPPRRKTAPLLPARAHPPRSKTPLGRPHARTHPRAHLPRSKTPLGRPHARTFPGARQPSPAHTRTFTPEENGLRASACSHFPRSKTAFGCPFAHDCPGAKRPSAAPTHAPSPEENGSLATPTHAPSPEENGSLATPEHTFPGGKPRLVARMRTPSPEENDRPSGRPCIRRLSAQRIHPRNGDPVLWGTCAGAQAGSGAWCTLFLPVEGGERRLSLTKRGKQ